MSAVHLLSFEGVAVSSDFLVGTIPSRELIAKFGKSWLPWYQRDRVLSTKKIASLKEIFKANKKIDSIKLNLLGQHTVGKKHGEALIEGEFHVIDGQQRLWALQESNVLDIRIPIELYLNIPMPEEVRLFHQFNNEGTDLSFGELAKSAQGELADTVRAYLKRKNAMAIPISVNGNRDTIGLPRLCPVMYRSHRKMFRGVFVKSGVQGKILLRFLEAPIDKSEVAMLMFAVKNILQVTVDLFGSFDKKATAYKRTFFQAWTVVVINNFLSDDGKVSYGKFSGKVKEIPDKVINNSFVREVVKTGGESAFSLLYDEIVKHLNHKLKSGHLPLFNELTSSTAREIDHLEMPLTVYQ